MGITTQAGSTGGGSRREVVRVIPQAGSLHEVGPEPSGRSRQVLADVAKALAHPDRIWILQLLADGERSVADLRTRTGQVASTLSSHLAVLRHADLVTVRREGPAVFYRLVDGTALAVVEALRGVVVGTLDRRDVDFGAEPEDRRH